MVSRGDGLCWYLAAPIELKILATLRVLGRGYCFDGVEELTLISAEVLRLFFRKFCKLFSEEYFHEYCSPPKSDEEIASAVSIYGKLGLPGCILKGRFRCLKLPIYLHDKPTIDSMFFTCCILHNIPAI